MKKFEQTVTIDFGITEQIDDIQMQRYNAAVVTFARELLNIEAGEWYGRETLIKGEGDFLLLNMFSVLESKVSEAKEIIESIIQNFNLKSFCGIKTFPPVKSNKDYAKIYQKKDKMGWTFFKKVNRIYNEKKYKGK